MNNLIKAIKSINIKQILTVLLAGCLVFISTACSQNDAASLGQTGRETAKTYQKTPRDTYDNYDANQGYEGGMNGYNDDRRYDAKTAAKSKALVDTARSRKADDLEDFADNIGDRAINGKTTKRALGKASNRLEDNLDDAAEYVDNKSSKLKRNLKQVPGGAKDVANEAADTAKGAVKDATKASKKTAKNIKDNFEDLDVDLDLS